MNNYTQELDGVLFNKGDIVYIKKEKTYALEYYNAKPNTPYTIDNLYFTWENGWLYTVKELGDMRIPQSWLEKRE